MGTLSEALQLADPGQGTRNADGSMDGTVGGVGSSGSTLSGALQAATQDAPKGKLRMPVDVPVKPDWAKEADASPDRWLIGAGEGLVHGATSAFAGIPAGAAALGATVGDMIQNGEWFPSKATTADALQKAKGVQNELTYDPRTQAGQDIVSGVDSALGHEMPGQTTLFKNYNPRPDLVSLGGVILPAVAPFAAKGAGSAVADTGETALDSALGRTAAAPAGAAAPIDAGAVPRPAVSGADPLAVAPYAPGGSAAATIGTQGTASSPQLIQAMRENALAAQRGEGTFNAKAAQRHIDADRIGVQLSEGQATGDGALISEELNARKELGTGENFHAQDQQLGQVLTDLRDKVGPDVFASDPIGLGQIALDAKKAEALADRANVRGKYQALQDAAQEANLPNMGIDTDTMFSNIDTALKNKLLTHHVPEPIARTLQGVRDGSTPLTVEGYESLRTQLADAQRSGGSESAAAGVIRDQLEAMPMTPEAAKLKALADDARQTAAKVFAKQDNRRLNTFDPAYAEASRDLDTPIGSPSPLAPTFAQKHVLSANPVYMQRGLDNLKAAADSGMIDPAIPEQARQAAAVTMLEELKKKAAVGERDKAFAADTYNNTLKALQPKLGVFGSDATDTLETVGRVSGYVKDRPPGNTVNYSNTAVDQRPGLLQQAAGSLVNRAIQATGNAAGFGVVPFGTEMVERRAARAAQRLREDRIDKQWGPAAGTLTRTQ